MSAYGRLFQIFGPELEKLLSPNQVFVRGQRFWCQRSEDDGQGAILDGNSRRRTAVLGRQVTGIRTVYIDRLYEDHFCAFC